MPTLNLDERKLAGAHPSPRFQSILVATDLSAHEDSAVQRACSLAGSHRATVTLMHLPQRGQVVPPAAATRLANAARLMEDTLGVRVKTAPVQAHRLEDLVAQARRADLVVLPHRREVSTAAFFMGQPVLRILRACGRPVLVTRGSGGAHYGRILVAVDFSAQSQALVGLAAELDARAELQLFHAVGTLGEAQLRSAEATEHALRAYRARCLRDAQERMLSLRDSFDTRRNRLFTTLGRGDPGRQTVIQQEYSDADLVVLGKRDTSAWQDFFCGSVAHRVLSWGSSDVLLVPQGELQASAPVAARRMRAGQADMALVLRSAGRRTS